MVPDGSHSDGYSSSAARLSGNTDRLSSADLSFALVLGDLSDEDESNRLRSSFLQELFVFAGLGLASVTLLQLSL